MKKMYCDLCKREIATLTRENYSSESFCLTVNRNGMGNVIHRPEICMDCYNRIAKFISLLEEDNES